MKNNSKIKAAREKLGGILSQRRKQMGITQGQLAEHIGMPIATIQGIENGKFIAGIDQILQVCAALELETTFIPLEQIRKGTLLDMDGKAKFLFAPDADKGELFILHRQFPACLIQVIQTTPVTFRAVDLYDNIEEADLLVHPFWEEVKEFWRTQGGKML